MTQQLGYEALAVELLRDIVTASDRNDGEGLMNCIESAREFLDLYDGNYEEP